MAPETMHVQGRHSIYVQEGAAVYYTVGYYMHELIVLSRSTQPCQDFNLLAVALNAVEQSSTLQTEFSPAGHVFLLMLFAAHGV